MITFSALIYKNGINPCVDVPLELSRTLQERSGYIPVKGKLNDARFTANLVPVKNGPYRLFLNQPIRTSAKADVGDVVTVILDYDPTVRLVPMPSILSQALKTHPKARSIWNKLPSSRKKDIKRYLNNLKTPAAVEKNVEKLLRKWDVG